MAGCEEIPRSSGMNAGRIWLANQLLRDRVGHHFGYNLAIADAAQRAGIHPQLVAHRDFREPVPAGVPVHRLFRTDFRANPPALAAGNQRLLRWLEIWCDRRFAGDLGRLPATGRGDMVFAQMLAPRHFIRWISWQRTRPEAPALFLHLGYRPERFAEAGVRRALESGPGGMPGRTVLVTDSEKLCTAFGRVLDREVHYLPHIVSHEIPVNSREDPGTAPLNVFVPGNARREKGFMEMVEAAQAIASSENGRFFRFTIQCHSPDIPCARFLGGLDAESSPIEWINRPLDDAEYLARLAQADIVLLPYHLDCYAARTSGIFTEARVAGVPVLTTRGSWAGDRVAREGGGWLAPERDVRELAAAILDARRTHGTAKREALSLAGAAGREFNRDNFMEKLLSLARGGGLS